MKTAGWLSRDRGAPDSRMPGLHFGEAGVSVALSEAIAGGLLARTSSRLATICDGLNGVLDWPDLTHGAAGQGLAALYCGDRLRDAAICGLANRCADYLLKSQRPDGSWAWPLGSSLTGFAHGVAGITYFVAEHARRTGDPAAERAWRRASEWLLGQSEVVDNALMWPIGVGSSDRWRWWCHGSVGIAVLYLRLYEQTGERRFADVARRALYVHSPSFLAPNLSQCHGYSGVGETYLEAHRVLGDPEWKLRADNVERALWGLRHTKDDNAAVWFVETPQVATADLMVGVGGVVHFLLRASRRQSPIGLPLLLDPLHPR